MIDCRFWNIVQGLKKWPVLYVLENQWLFVNFVHLLIVRASGPGEQSGFGFELTFRLKAQEGDESAPMWPASLMNALARYVFQTGIMLLLSALSRYQ